MSAPVKSVPIPLLGLLALLATGFLVTGCTKSPGLDPQKIEAYRTEFMLADEPEGIQTVADVRASLLGEEGDDHDHDGDGQPDHAAEDHAAEDHEAEDDSAEDHTAEDHDEDGHGAEEHDNEHAHDDHAHETESQQVAMVGHIGGLANPWSGSHPDYPFAKNEATFFLADPQAAIENAESGHQHAPGEECAFCAAHAGDKANMIAMVRFIDEKGKVLQTDIRDLFNVKENDTVIVHGEARVTTGGILVVDARGLYIRN